MPRPLPSGENGKCEGLGDADDPNEPDREDFKQLISQLVAVYDKVRLEKDAKISELAALKLEVSQLRGDGSSEIQKVMPLRPPKKVSILQEDSHEPDQSFHEPNSAPDPPPFALADRFSQASAAESGEDTKLEIRPTWLEKPKNAGAAAKRASTLDLDELTESSDEGPPCCCPFPVCHPSAGLRVLWDICGALLIAYDAVYLPFDAAFRPAPSVFTVGMEWLTMVFWTLDIGLGFTTGYVSKGELIMNPWRIAFHYITTWFLIDAAVVSLDWFSTLQSETSDVGGFGRIFRSLRTVRMLRLLRLWKLKRILAEMQDMIDSEYVYTLASLGKLMGFILITNHLIACGWFSIGLAMKEAGEASWVADHDMINKDISWQYTTSLHWTLTQFTPASMEVFPANVAERTMAVVVLIFSLVAFSSFLASISASMTALRNMNQETTKQFWILRRFLKQEKVAKPVAGKVLKYIEHSHAQQTDRIQLQNVKLLSMLSLGLREELNYELTYVKMVLHPLIQILVKEQEVFMIKVCSDGTSARTLAATEVLFYTHEVAQQMYFMVHGDLAYVQANHNLLSPALSNGEALSEAALWVLWTHTGTAHAQVKTEMLAMDSLTFAQIAAKYLPTWKMCAKFATTFLEAFREAGPSDVFRQQDLYEDAVQSMFERARNRLSYSRVTSSRATMVRWSMPRRTVALPQAEAIPEEDSESEQDESKETDSKDN